MTPEALGRLRRRGDLCPMSSGTTLAERGLAITRLARRNQLGKVERHLLPCAPVRALVEGNRLFDLAVSV